MMRKLVARSSMCGGRRGSSSKMSGSTAPSFVGTSRERQRMA